MNEFPRRAMKVKMNKRSKILHICEVIRQINDCAQGNTPNDLKIRQLCAIASSQAKRMSKKLYEYNKEWDAGWWAQNPEYEKQLLARVDSGYKVETVDYKNAKDDT